MRLKEFFEYVVTGGEGSFCLAIGPHNGHGWMEEWYDYPADLDRIVDRALELGPTRNVYFSSYLFSERSSVKENVVPSRTIQADLDEADVSQLPIVPSVLIQSSPGRHQAYWLLSDGPLDKEAHEILSRKITYSIPLCDRSGWALGRKVRVPFTNNFKYPDGPKPVTIIGDSQKQYNSADFELLPDIAKAEVDRYESGFTDKPLPNGDLSVGPAELFGRFKPKLNAAAIVAFGQRDTKDRSKALWTLLTALFRAGATKEEVFWIARGSANNKFAELRHHSDRELAKDVLRAEAVVLKNQLDPRSLIEQARRKSGPVTERRALVAQIVLEFMKQRGSLLHALGGAPYYIPRDTGRPIIVSRHSQYFDVLLDLQYGLNAVEIDTHYVASSILSHAKNAPEVATVSQLSSFLRDSRSLLLHTGRKDVLRITATSVDKVTNGAHNVIFPWRDLHEPFAPNLNVDPCFDWGHFLFVETIPGVNGLENIVGLEPDEALALLKVWFMFLLFRDLSASRPILTALGQPGCLAGDTIIGVRRGSHSERLFTIRDAYERSRTSWDTSITTRMLSLKDDVIMWRDVHKIVSSGRKMVYDLRVEGHGTIKATADHKFLTTDGWKPLSELVVGDKLVTKGTNVFSRGKVAKTRTIVSANFHPYARQKMVNGYGPYGSILRCRAVIEAALNGLTYDEFIAIVHTDKDRAATLEYLDKDVHIHHLDENPENDALENLQVMTKIGHDTHHGLDNVTNLGEWSGRFYPSWATVDAITENGVTDTYDVQMEDEEAQNFLVNGVVVHNSGKTTLFKKLYKVLYGGQKAVSSITTPDDFDHGTANTAFYAMDNVDTWERWLPDRLALAAAPSSIDKRVLFTDSDIWTMKRQALVGISAHNPKFGREDVADRMLIVMFRRLEKFASEDAIYDAILRRRNDIWGSIVKSAQKILQTNPPSDAETPQFRIEDFAKVGLWIARSLDHEAAFISGLDKTRINQRAFTLEEDSLLVTALRKVVATGWLTTPRAPGEIWAKLERASDDPPAFGKAYKNSVSLGKKLWSMEEALKQQFDVSWQTNKDQPGRLWAISTKGSTKA